MPGPRQRPLTGVLLNVVGPVLIMLMVGSLVFFLINIVYSGPHYARLCWVFGLFSAASVLVSRISITEGHERAGIFGFALAAATFITGSRLVSFDSAAWIAGPILLVVFIAVVMWSVSKLTWDTTVIDNSRDPSAMGMLELFKRKIQRKSLNETPASQNALDAPNRPDPVPDTDARAGNLLFALLKARGGQNTPGLWVFYFSCAALPIFGLGQLFAASADPASLAWAGTLFGIYIAAALGLMATTSLLGLQRYLNGRGLELPESVSRKWMTLAATTAMIIFLILWALPKPNLESGLHSSLAFFTSKNSNPSSWALGRDGQKQGARPTSQTKGDQGKQTNQGQGKTGEGGQGEPKSSGEGTKSESKSNSSNASKSQSDSSSKSSEKSGADSKSPQPDPQSPNSKSPNAKSPPAETNKESGESKPQSPSEMRDAAQQQAAEKARENARDKNPDDQNKSAANQQDQQPNQNNSNQQKQTPPKNPDQSSGGSTNNNSPPPMNQPPMNLGPWAKWLTYLVGITALVVFAILFRRELIQLWLELLAFFQGLTGKKPAADPIAAAETNTVNRTRSKSFRDFANPFEKQTNTNFDDQQLVTYTFAAFEALGADARLDRGADETPHEFASRLARRLDALTNVARNFIDIYCQSIYGGGNLARIDRESVKSFWDAMNSANQRLQQNTNS